MYTGRGFQHSELGDVDVILHEGLFHLFHLVLPNHDYIAHAVSSDGFLWRRVKNPLFIGEPGDWDDDMLWTMHVSRDPDGPSAFRMFYTGLSRREGGRVQRIGLARSNDLYNWDKVSSANYPLSIEGPHYESTVDEGRKWVSCRDPFFFNEEGERLLLVNARVAEGPIIRRGCIGVAREVETDIFRWEKPLFFPRMYDDVEVPSLHRIGDIYYLIGNIREDIKIHYWHSDSLFGEYQAHASNVLLPRGNYASRITRDGDRHLLWNFYSVRGSDRPSTILPPPAELLADKEGCLYLRSYSGFNKKVVETIDSHHLAPKKGLLHNDTAAVESRGDAPLISSRSGYEIFPLVAEASDFRLRMDILMEGIGKAGLVFRGDEEANGHFISLDIIQGIAQARTWSYQEEAGIENAFQYEILQGARFPGQAKRLNNIELVVYGGYIEFSVDGKIVLRYVNTEFMEQTLLGIYLESAELLIENLQLEKLAGPEEEDHQLF